MIKEAEDMAEQDKQVREKVESRNALENYVYQMKAQIGDDDKLAKKVSDEDKATADAALKKATEWLGEHANSAITEDFEEQKKTLESILNPIVSKVYANSDGNEGGASTDHQEL